jgi:hypothetical protein
MKVDKETRSDERERVVSGERATVGRPLVLRLGNGIDRSTPSSMTLSRLFIPRHPPIQARASANHIMSYPTMSIRQAPR